MRELTGSGSLGRVAVIGNYQPRRCGIATFTTDIVGALAAAAPATDWPVVAMNDIPQGYDYPPQVRLTIDQHDPRAYGRMAATLNAANVDLVLLQHEYGIFGGVAGDDLLRLTDALRAPLVTTLHTILAEPDADQRRVLVALARRSARLITMSRLGAERLRTIYGVPAAKIATIPHGIPDVPLVEPAPYKAALGLGERPLMLTFGLLSPGKGIETVIEALPRIVARHPDFAYLVVGETHPHIKARDGESYREGLVARAAELGVAGNLILDDRFLGLDELVGQIAAADIYITPYLGREQIVSGTLAYTVGAGKAVISTPYPYAEELLADGRGLLVPFGDSDAIAANVLALLDDPAARRALRERAYRAGRRMIWSAVAAQHLRLFREVLTPTRLVPSPRPVPVAAALHEAAVSS